MSIKINREELNPLLTCVGGVVERRQTLPILANLLFKVKNGILEITGTDLEIEIRTTHPVGSDFESEFTLPAKKIVDICRALPEGAQVEIAPEGERAVISSEKSRFILSTLPAPDYPTKEMAVAEHRIEVEEGGFKKLIEKTAFAMAQQDVRYYLNGMLFEIGDEQINAVATDGHRLAKANTSIAAGDATECEIIVPRKTILELNRLVQPVERPVHLEFSSTFFRISLGDTLVTTKLIEGRYPDYHRVIPKVEEKLVLFEREIVRKALMRTAILSNEKYKGIRLTFAEGKLRLQAHNPEQEQAEDEVPIEYEGESISIGFNVGYLLDVLTALEQDVVELRFTDSGSSTLIADKGDDSALYVIMPMRL